MKKSTGFISVSKSTMFLRTEESLGRAVSMTAAMQHSSVYMGFASAIESFVTISLSDSFSVMSGLKRRTPLNDLDLFLM